MLETVLTFLFGLLQIAGAVMSFGGEGVLAKLLGLIFCLTTLVSFAASLVFLNEYLKNKYKGGNDL